MDIEYKWILRQMENCTFIKLAKIDLIYWSVRSYSRMGGDGVK